MYDEELLDRNLHPRFRGEIKGVTPIQLKNASCGDEIEVFLQVFEGKIKDVRWRGKGCAISLSSADFFAENMIGKTLEQAKTAKEEFSKMILNEEYDKEKLGAMEKMKCVSRMPARANCAKLALESLEKLA